MNWFVIGGITLTCGGIFFLGKKMKVGKSDLVKLKEKLNKKKSAEEKAFRNGEIILPIDKRDFEDFNSFTNAANYIENEDKRDNIIKNLNNIDDDFEKFKPEERFDFENINSDKK